MGAWGTGIFSNDTSRDVRESFAEYMGEGLSVDEVVERILSEYCFGDRLDPDNNDVWLALAAAQHASGHVTPEVINVALEITESPAELERWGSGNAGKRRAALQKLRETLLSEPRTPKRFKKKVLHTTERVPGDHELYSEGSLKLLLRVEGIARDSKGEYPLYTVLDWSGDVRQLGRAETLAPLPADDPVLGRTYFYFCVPRPLPVTSELKLLEAKSAQQDPVFKPWGFDSMNWAELLPYVRLRAKRIPPTI